MNELLIIFILKTGSANIYEIRKQINFLFAPFVQLSTGAIIPTLNRLEKKGIVQNEKTISDGGLKKTVYNLTDEAEKYFSEIIENIPNSAPQILRRDIETLFMLLKHHSLNSEENSLIINKLKELLDINIKSLETTLKANKMNIEFIKTELKNSLEKLNSLNEIIED